MSASERAITNRSIRVIRCELEFLADTGSITTEQLNHIFSILPAAESPVPVHSAHSPTPLPIAAPQPVSHYSSPAVPVASEKTLPLSPVTPQQAPPPSYTPTPLVLSRAEALWAFQGSEPGDLSFHAGSTIEVVEKVKDDWWRGRVVGQQEIGLFPSSYVRETQQMAKSPLPPLPARQGSAYGPGGNTMTEVAHGGQVQTYEEVEKEKKEKSKMQQNGEKFGKKLGNAAVFGAGATIGSKIVNGIF